MPERAPALADAAVLEKRTRKAEDLDVVAGRPPPADLALDLVDDTVLVEQEPVADVGDSHKVAVMLLGAATTLRCAFSS